MSIKLCKSIFSNVLSINEQQDQEETDGKSFVIRDDTTKTPEQAIIKSELLDDLAENIQKLNEKNSLFLVYFTRRS